MKTTAIAVSLPQVRSRSCLPERVADFVSLMKPRVMLLAVFTAVVGLAIAPGHLDLLRSSVAIFAIATGACAAGVLNMWYEADIDAVMTRTARRPIPRGAVSRLEAPAFGLILACSAVAVLGLALNLKAAALLAFAIFFYVVVYTIWLKRSTPQNIVIGGAAGALPPVIGWVAATGDIGFEPIIFFLIIFLWTPPHFWALSLNRDENMSAPASPCSLSLLEEPRQSRQIFIYSVLLVPISGPPWMLGFAGALYAAIALPRRRDFRRARHAAAQEQRNQSASGSPPVRVFHSLPVRVVRGAVSKQWRKSRAGQFFDVCRSD